MTTLEETLQTALKHHDCGEFASAETLYRQILSQTPQHPDALHLLGVLIHQSGRHAEGIEWVKQAIKIQPQAQFWANLGELCRIAGRLEEGELACRRAIEIAPNLASAYHNLAAIYEQEGRLMAALEVAQKGVALAPRDAGSRRIYGGLLTAVGKKVEAAVQLKQAIALGPPNGMGWLQLSTALEKADQIEAAIYCCDRAVQLMPNAVQPLNRLALMLLARAEYGQALTRFEKLQKLDPDNPNILMSIAACYEGLNRFEEAIHLSEMELQKNPHNFSAHSIIANARLQSCALEACEAGILNALKIRDIANLYQILATCLARQGRLEESLNAINRAIQLAPDFSIAIFCKGLIYIFMGRFEEAWPYLEARWRHPHMDGWRHITDKPVWDGSPLEGKTILLYAEQGLGDTVQFARYIPLIHALGGTVVVEVQPPLKTLIETIPGVARVVARGTPVGDYDTLAPLCSLPGLLNTRLDTIPDTVPYLHIPSVHRERAVLQLPQPDGRLRVGLAWMGNPNQRENHIRSMTLAQCAPLARVEGVHFFSLQKGAAAAEAEHPPAGMDLFNLDPLIHDFMDTAAFMTHMDLIISVDTSVVHVAGALALPIWTLLCRNIGHMWMQNRDDSPWYPTMRLFRQPVCGEWEPVMERVAQELANYINSDRVGRG